MRFRYVGKGRRPAQTAYTIVEVVMAVLVVGILTVSLYAGFASGFTVMQTTRENLRATQVLVKKLEAVRLIRWDQLRNMSFQERYDPLGATTNAGGVLYSGTLTTNAATSIPDMAAYKPDVRLVTVTVYWTNGIGTNKLTHSRTMSTHVSRYGMQNYIYGVNTVTTPNANPPPGDDDDDREHTKDYDHQHDDDDDGDGDGHGDGHGD